MAQTQATRRPSRASTVQVSDRAEVTARQPTPSTPLPSPVANFDYSGCYRPRHFAASGASDMDREEGMDALRRGGWLRDTPAEFRDALLSQSRWQRLDAGALI